MGFSLSPEILPVLAGTDYTVGLLNSFHVTRTWSHSVFEFGPERLFLKFSSIATRHVQIQNRSLGTSCSKTKRKALRPLFAGTLCWFSHSLLSLSFTSLISEVSSVTNSLLVDLMEIFISLGTFFFPNLIWDWNAIEYGPIWVLFSCCIWILGFAIRIKFCRDGELRWEECRFNAMRASRSQYTTSDYIGGFNRLHRLHFRCSWWTSGAALILLSFKPMSVNTQFFGFGRLIIFYISVFCFIWRC